MIHISTPSSLSNHVYHLDQCEHTYPISSSHFTFSQHDRLIISPFFGRLSEVYGYRAVLVLTSLVLCAGTLIYTAADDVYTLLLAQVVMGIGSGTLGVTRAYVAESTQRSKRTVLLAYLTGMFLGCGYEYL